ncbi:MAG TPA: TIR domain-containing protein [Hyphomicrobiaceae bacterium]|nr:TIR domain-containing protein [Hyphomicrobiaceae bacterium]
MAEGKGEAGRLAVFISYSRDDLQFADQLDATLGIGGFETVIDRLGIRAGEEWEPRLGALIRNADTVVFVLTPSSARSKICEWEVEEARRLGKRIMPVVPGPLGDAQAPPGLAALNYIFFYNEPKKPGSSFGAGLRDLVDGLKTDLEWLREHTRLLQRATEWEVGGRPENRLLSGNDIVAAKAWAARRPKDAPAPTTLHLDFIKASEAWEAKRASEESRRLEERERLVRGAEVAQHERDAATRRVVRSTVAGLVAALLLAIIAGGFGFYAFEQKGDADAQRQVALSQKSEAESRKVQAEAEAERADKAAKDAAAAQSEALKTRDEALLTQSKFLADLSRQLTEQEKDPGTGLLLALEALRDEQSDNAVTRGRPYWPRAEASLEAARRLLRELAVVRGHTDPVLSMAVSPDGARIVIDSADNTARVWDAKTFAELAVLKGHTDSVLSVAVSPDGARIVTGSEDTTARVWDAKIFAELAVLEGHTGSVSSVALSPDGARIVTGSEDTTARVWDSRTFAELAELKGHMDWVSSAAVSPDGARIITGSGDRTARVWDAKTFAELAMLKGHTAPVQSVAVSPDGALILTASWDNTARVWEVLLTGQALIDEAKAIAPRCLTAAQRQLYHLAPAPPLWCTAMQKWPY